jgi:clan AA aspartic protease (TIGR02281 family)
MRRLLAVIAAVLIICGHSAFAQGASVWRWMDESGSAHISGSLEDVPANRRASAVPMKYSTVAEPAPEPVSPKPELLEEDRLARFDHSDGMVAVKAVIGGSTERGAWIDTGSELTVITSKLAVALGVDIKSSGKRVFHTQNGRVNAPVTILKSVKVGPATARDVMAAIMDFPGRGPVSAIIGMNFLSLFRFEINMREGVIIFGDRTDSAPAKSGQASPPPSLKREDER